ncbi:MAG: hypothetical protein U0168_16750 [Nannocystaceae bacterium]
MREPWRRRTRSWAAWLGVGLAACTCGDPPAATHDDAAPSEDREQVEPPASIAAPPRGALTVYHGSELDALELAEVDALEIAFAESDRLGRIGEFDASDVCTSIDLAAVAGRAKALRSLRISGCPALARQLVALPRLEQLTLAELELDAEAVAAIASLGALRSLTLVRVGAPEALALEPLAKLPLQQLELIELPKTTELGRMLDLWPRSLTHVTLAGAWLDHEAMTTLSKAAAVEVLEIRDSRIGNFSLNQIKPLSHLREVLWAGDNFNDNSPLYFRDLPVRRFRCDCPRFGDAGLHTLRLCPRIEALELPRSSVTGPGLAHLVKLPALAQLILLERDIGEAGLETLRNVPSLRRLELAGDVADGRMQGLAGLTQLERLRLHVPELDDRATANIGALTRLQELDLAGTQVSDAGLAQLEPLVELRTLVLSRTRVTNRGLAHVAALGKLQHLQLDHTDVVDAGVEHLARLHDLRSLRLDHTLVTDAATETLLQLSQLQRLDLSGTVVTAAGAARLESLPQLAELRLLPAEAREP